MIYLFHSYQFLNLLGNFFLPTGPGFSRRTKAKIKILDCHNRCYWQLGVWTSDRLVPRIPAQLGNERCVKFKHQKTYNFKNGDFLFTG